jgi:hypothetical protein
MAHGIVAATAGAIVACTPVRFTLEHRPTGPHAVEVHAS